MTSRIRWTVASSRPTGWAIAYSSGCDPPSSGHRWSGASGHAFGEMDGGGSRRSRGGVVDAGEPGDVVSIHWDWACERLDQRRLSALRTWTAREIEIANKTM